MRPSWAGLPRTGAAASARGGPPGRGEVAERPAPWDQGLQRSGTAGSPFLSPEAASSHPHSCPCTRTRRDVAGSRARCAAPGFGGHSPALLPGGGLTAPPCPPQRPGHLPGPPAGAVAGSLRPGRPGRHWLLPGPAGGSVVPGAGRAPGQAPAEAPVLPRSCTPPTTTSRTSARCACLSSWRCWTWRATAWRTWGRCATCSCARGWPRSPWRATWCACGHAPRTRCVWWAREGQRRVPGPGSPVPRVRQPAAAVCWGLVLWCRWRPGSCQRVLQAGTKPHTCRAVEVCVPTHARMHAGLVQSCPTPRAWTHPQPVGAPTTCPGSCCPGHLGRALSSGWLRRPEGSAGP